MRSKKGVTLCNSKSHAFAIIRHISKFIHLASIHITSNLLKAIFDPYSIYSLMCLLSSGAYNKSSVKGVEFYVEN